MVDFLDSSTSSLTNVFRSLCCNWNSVSDTLDIGGGSGIWAIECIWLDGWITLKVDVECDTFRTFSAVSGASVSIITCQGLVSQVRSGLSGSLEILEANVVAVGSGRVL